MSRPVTIHSDGTGHGTFIVDEDGNRIANVASVNIYISANAVVEATIEVYHPSVVTQAQVTEVTWSCPICNTIESHKCDNELGGSAPQPLLKICPDHPTGDVTLAGACAQCGKNLVP